MADAEQERRKMTDTIGSLERKNKALEAENARTIEDNRILLNSLEELNSSITESDSRIQSLTASLQSSQTELQRLTVLASRTSQLEAQLSALEEEQAHLHSNIATTKEEERSAVQRWKKAERTILELEEQIHAIEREAREERERHVDIMGRLERRRAVEKELDQAAGRLKGAAAATTIGQDKPGTSVVSHFVKDILQDNTKLQMGIVELRELLLSSNEEVEALREQLSLHQPVQTSSDGIQSSNLGKELEVERAKEEKREQSLPQIAFPHEVHVHHHYHSPTPTPSASGPSTPMKDRAFSRRTKKKRNPLTPGHFAPPGSSPRPPAYFPMGPAPPSTAATILSQTSVSIPPTPPSSNRWSIQSTQSRMSFANSSIPSSPSSMYRESTIFDRAFNALDSSRPTSPESNADMRSPRFGPRHSKKNSDGSIRSFAMPNTNNAATLAVPQLSVLNSTLEEDNDADAEPDYSQPLGHVSNLSSDEDLLGPPDLDFSDATATDTDTFAPRTLRRSASHESILSAIATIDSSTPTLRGKNSAIFQPFSTRTPVGITSPSQALEQSRPVISQTTVTARTSGTYNSRNYNRQLLSAAPPEPLWNNKETPRKVGSNWFWGRWGVSPMASTGNLRGKARAMAAVTLPEEPEQPKDLVRLGSSGPVITEVDEDLLREALNE